MAPPPAAGERSERNLAVRANADATDDGLGAVVRLIQETSAAAVEVPVRLRLEPSSLRTADSDLAELHVVVDNRAGHRERRVWLTGNDPETADRVRVPDRRAVGGARRRTRHARCSCAPRCRRPASRRTGRSP